MKSRPHSLHLLFCFSFRIECEIYALYSSLYFYFYDETLFLHPAMQRVVFYRLENECCVILHPVGDDSTR